MACNSPVYNTSISEYSFEVTASSLVFDMHIRRLHTGPSSLSYVRLCCSAGNSRFVHLAVGIQNRCFAIKTPHVTYNCPRNDLGVKIVRDDVGGREMGLCLPALRLRNGLF